MEKKVNKYYNQLALDGHSVRLSVPFIALTRVNYKQYVL